MNTATAVATATERLNHLELLERPEIREALTTLRTALERLHEEYAPIVNEAKRLPGQAELVEVVDQPSYEFANQFVREVILPVRDRAKEIIDPYTEAGNIFHKAMVSLRKLVTEPGNKQSSSPVEHAIRIIDGRCMAYNQDQEWLRREAEAREAAERERLELKAKCEAVWSTIWWLAAAVAEAELKKAELAKIAETAEQEGDKEAAEAIREEMQTAPLPPPLEPEIVIPPMAPPAVLPDKPKAEGTSLRKNFKARLASIMSLVAFVAQHPEHHGLLLLNQTAADKLAKAYEEKLGQIIPGLEAWNDAGISRKRR